MKLSIVLAGLLLLEATVARGQQAAACGSVPAGPQVQEAVERRLLEEKDRHTASRGTGNVYYLPVVVHVLYPSAQQDVPDALVRSYLQEVNKSFRKQHAASFTPRPVFDSLWADLELELCLADRDPSGAATTGITHTQTAATFTLTNVEQIKHSASGGKDAWPVATYLNIWIVQLTGSGGLLLGNAVNNNVYSSANATEGLVVNAAYPALMINNITHEAGHFLGLHHTFDNAAELVDDTPYEGTGGHAYLNSISTLCPSGDRDSNTSATESAYWRGLNPPDMIENFMGYDRPCQFMFTKGQKDRARAMLGAYYSGLVKSMCGLPAAVGSHTAAPKAIRIYYGAGTPYIRPDGFTAATDYCIYNAAGQAVRQGTLQPGTSTAVQDLPPGYYSIRAGALAAKIIVAGNQ